MAHSEEITSQTYDSGLNSSNMAQAAGSSRATVALLAFLSVRGLLVGVAKSRLMRILAPFIILGFLALGYYAWHAWRAVDWQGVDQGTSVIESN